MAIFLVYSTSGTTSGRKVCRELKMAAIWKFWNIKHSFNLTSDMEKKSKIMPKNGDDIIDDVTGWSQSFSMNNTFRDCRSKVNVTGLLGDLGT